MKKKMIALLLMLALTASMGGCGSADGSGTSGTSEASEASDAAEGEGTSGVEDGVLTIAMECAYAPYNWTQTDDSNGAVPIKYSNE